MLLQGSICAVSTLTIQLYASPCGNSTFNSMFCDLIDDREYRNCSFRVPLAEHTSCSPVGDCVGNCVGASVGNSVGASVGSVEVGNSVGTSVGAFEEGNSVD